MGKQKSSVRLRTATTPENKLTIEEMICSQEDHPETHFSPRDIAKELKISQSSVRRMIKGKEIQQFKHLTTPYMNDTSQKRRVEHAAGCLLEKFEANLQMIERAVFQDESDFPL